MKFLKLILFVAVVVGVVAGIMLLDFGDSDRGKIKPGTPTYKKIEGKINDAWSEGASWSQDKYNKAKADINAYNKDLSNSAYENLRHTNALLAMDAIHRDMMNEFSHSECSGAKVKDLNQAAIALSKDEVNQLQGNAKLKECNNTYSLYAEIISFGKESFALSPGFNIEKGTFNSFPDFKKRKLNQRDGYRANPLFSKISNIYEVNKALNRVEGELNTQANNYPGRVADSIIAAFNKAEYTEDNLARYIKAINNYSASYSIPNRLNQHYKNFQAKVEEQKRNMEQI